MIRPLRLLLLIVAATLFPRIAAAKHVRYVGGHPVASKYGGGYCYIEVPHVHIYPPDHPNLYQQVGDHYVFTADPSPFGYEGEKHTFYGHHPVVTVGNEPVFCYLDGPHVHPFAPPDTSEYKTKGQIAFYVGPFPPSYMKLRPHRQKVVNAEYRPYAALRPTVQVRPPPEWQGEVWVAPPTVVVPSVSVVGPRVGISAPGVIVAPPAPPSVTVSAPGIVVAPPRPGIVVAPPRPGIVVAPPRPGIVVAPPRPGVVVVEGEHGHRDRHEEEHRHGRDEEHDHGHDHGKHKGWYKHHD